MQSLTPSPLPLVLACPAHLSQVKNIQTIPSYLVPSSFTQQSRYSSHHLQSFCSKASQKLLKFKQQKITHPGPGTWCSPQAKSTTSTPSCGSDRTMRGKRSAEYMSPIAWRVRTPEAFRLPGVVVDEGDRVGRPGSPWVEHPLGLE